MQTTLMRKQFSIEIRKNKRIDFYKKSRNRFIKKNYKEQKESNILFLEPIKKFIGIII